MQQNFMFRFWKSVSIKAIHNMTRIPLLKGDLYVDIRRDIADFYILADASFRGLFKDKAPGSEGYKGTTEEIAILMPL